MKGIIALDIDGTITVDMNPILPKVVDYFHKLVDEDWRLIFITGRTFQWSYQVLKVLNFPYYVAVQNGALIIEMPSHKVLSKKYLDQSIIPQMELICEDLATDFVIYAGFEYQDLCYFRPSHFSSSLLDYLRARSAALKEVWCEVKSFDNFAIPEFPSVKCFGPYEIASQAAQKIEKTLNLHVPIITDPFQKGYYVAQATRPEVDKGLALQNLSELLNHQGIVIAAGNDNNDRSMLSKADIKVVMANAPQDMQANADIVAPLPEKMGIISGLSRAIEGL